MAENANVLRQWLDMLPEGCSVGIDDGGLTLVCVEDPEIYYEIGGISESDEPKCECGGGALPCAPPCPAAGRDNVYRPP